MTHQIHRHADGTMHRHGHGKVHTHADGTKHDHSTGAHTHADGSKHVHGKGEGGKVHQHTDGTEHSHETGKHTHKDGTVHDHGKKKPLLAKDEFKELNKDGKGGLSKSEIKLADPRIAEALKDKKNVSLEDYQAATRQVNSFEALDADGDEKLEAEELAKAKSFTGTKGYDADGKDGVSKDEFVKARQEDWEAKRTAIRRERFEALTGPQKAALAKHYGKDGQLTFKDFNAGREKDREQWYTARAEEMFKKAGGKDGQLDLSKAKQYASYAKDGETLSKADFIKAYKADIEAAKGARALNRAGLDQDLANRLGVDAEGQWKGEAKFPPIVKGTGKTHQHKDGTTHDHKSGEHKHADGTAHKHNTSVHVHTDGTRHTH